MHAAYSVQLIAYNQPGDRLACTLIKTCTPLCSQQLLPVAVHNVFANSSGSLQQKLADLHKFSDTFARFLNRRLVCAFASLCICSVCCLYFVYLRSFPLERQSVVSSSFVRFFFAHPKRIKRRHTVPPPPAEFANRYERTTYCM